MIATYRRLERRRAAGEIDGFTLIEMLIVIVVIGTLAAVVIFALGGIIGKSAVAACQADGGTVSTAIATFETQNPAYGPSGTAVTPALLTGTTLGGPYIQAWPSNSPHYVFQLTSGSILEVSTGVVYSAGPPVTYTPGVAAGNVGSDSGQVAPGGGTTPWITYAGPTSCTGVV